MSEVTRELATRMVMKVERTGIETTTETEMSVKVKVGKRTRERSQTKFANKKLFYCEKNSM